MRFKLLKLSLVLVVTLGVIAGWTPVRAQGPLPTSCQDIRGADPTAPDGDYVIYPNGQVFKVYCHDMAGTPREYLSLVNTGGASNFSQYTAAASQGTDVRTYYDKVRIDPDTLLIHIGDQTFAASTGSLMTGSTEVTSMPYGVAMDCLALGSQAGVANIDLRGTPFAVSDPFLLGGYYPAGQAVFSSSEQVVDLTGGGFCGWIQPDPYVLAPFNDRGDFQLDLKYVGPGPALNPSNCNYYELGIPSPLISWHAANNASSNMTLNGRPGHLATITSEEENNFLEVTFGPNVLYGMWLGGYQEAGVVPADYGWQWVTGEPFVYTNWAPGEPNDGGCPACEQYLMYWDDATWNDGDLPVSGYVVEYGTGCVKMIYLPLIQK